MQRGVGLGDIGRGPPPDRVVDQRIGLAEFGDFLGENANGDQPRDRFRSDDVRFEQAADAGDIQWSHGEAATRLRPD